jgi:23S rRNA (pseudouridine1915-N3)-methyltransferase
MRVLIHAVGRMKAGPERELAQRYLDRFSKSAPSLGLEFTGVTETIESRAKEAALRKHDEALKLHETLQPGTVLVLLDERGNAPSSAGFAAIISKHRDSGTRSMVFAIGGPDGHDPELRTKAQHVIAFGAMSFPHQIMRILLAEQLYRAVTILSGHPYHRE